MNLAERKRLLVLDCAADRAAWVRACYRPAPGPAATILRKALHWTGTLGAVLPGRFGRMLRGATFVAEFARNFALRFG